ncbi:hypothetical protein DXD91_00150 [Anaerobutyricum hallii]|uniref:Uncharacterized protein n=1 Tax=Anaerobutyricum hallii TaxID=39488 RepID=A0A374NVM0_9FIRM|nr:hypothetical protein DXD91_00150 [Anaerobutyricum hallii]
MKNHSYNLHAPICGIFCLHSVDVARYAALIQAKSPTNCNAHLAESIFQTRSGSDVIHHFLNTLWNLFQVY